MHRLCFAVTFPAKEAMPNENKRNDKVAGKTNVAVVSVDCAIAG